MSLLIRAALILTAIAAGSAGGDRPPSPAQSAIERARAAIEKKAADPRLRAELAIALARRARETGDPAFYDQAEAALKECFRISPGNFDGEKAAVWILLGKHEFREALKKAKELEARMPDDILVYAFLTDANVELGDYEAAERAAQWSLDMRPGEISGLTRAAYLRELFGDIDGAREFMASAFGRTPVAEVEDRAWILTQIGHLFLLEGDLENAEKALREAYHIFPDYHYTVAGFGALRTAQKKYPEAVKAYRALYEAAKHPENLYFLAAALKRTGDSEEAARLFADFEKGALAESEGTDNANRELIYYYVDHAGKPAEALRIAEKEIARRHDVHTLRAHAWALSAAGRPAEARKQIEKALAVGIRDPGFFYHAGIICEKAGDRAAARRHVRASLELARESEWSERAAAALARLEEAERPAAGGGPPPPPSGN